MHVAGGERALKGLDGSAGSAALEHTLTRSITGLPASAPGHLSFGDLNLKLVAAECKQSAPLAEVSLALTWTYAGCSLLAAHTETDFAANLFEFRMLRTAALRSMGAGARGDERAAGVLIGADHVRVPQARPRCARRAWPLSVADAARFARAAACVRAL